MRTHKYLSEVVWSWPRTTAANVSVPTTAQSQLVAFATARSDRIDDRLR